MLDRICSHVDSDHRSRYGIVNAPSEAAAMSNCIMVHPSDFRDGQHVLIKGGFVLTARYSNDTKDLFESQSNIY